MSTTHKVSRRDQEVQPELLLLLRVGPLKQNQPVPQNVHWKSVQQ